MTDVKSTAVSLQDRSTPLPVYLSHCVQKTWFNVLALEASHVLRLPVPRPSVAVPPLILQTCNIILLSSKKDIRDLIPSLLRPPHTRAAPLLRMPIRHNPIHRLGLIAPAHGKRLALVPDALLALEELGPVHQAPLVVDASIDEVRVIQRQLRRAVDDVIGRLHAQHEAVVLIAHLVAPAAEASPREDVLGLQGGEELFEHAFALQGRGGVAVVEAAVVGRDDLVGRLEHGGVEEAADGVGEEVVVVHRFEGGFGDFEHDTPVGAFLRGR